MLTFMCVIATFVFAGDSFPSGPQVGDKLPDFKLQGHFGPAAGKEIQLHATIKAGPTLLIFMHGPSENGITRPGLQFIRPVDKYAAEQDKLSTQIVWITGDKEKTEAFLKRAENSLALKSPVSICLDGGKAGPATYGLNDKVQITVLVAKDNKVVANFALTDPNANDSAKVIAAVAKLLGKDPPKGQPEEKKKARPTGEDATALEGKWKVTKMIKRGEQKAPDYFEGTYFLFSKNELTLSDKGDKRVFTVALDPGKKPKQIDLTSQAGSFKGRTVPCIYQFVGDSLVICMPHDRNENRPDAFESLNDREASRMLFTLEHVKE